MAFPDGILKTIVGTQGNLWTAVAVGIAGKSTAFDTSGCSQIYFHGNASGASTLTVETSADGATWNATGTTNAANGDFGFGMTGCAARYVRLSSSAAATITATATAKA